jgi:hypothetical protein
MGMTLFSDKHTFQYSHLGGTILWGDLLQQRKPWVAIDNNIYLGSMLFNQGKWLYENHTLDTFIESELLDKQKINIVQVVESHELTEKANPSLLVGVKDKSHALESSEHVNIVGPFAWADFKYDTAGDDAKLKYAFSDLYSKHEKGEVIYFHCKAGVNRSFRMAALFSVYKKIQERLRFYSKFERKGEKINSLQIDDYIMQACSDIWDKRPCVCFDRSEWRQQYSSLKKSVNTMFADQIDTSQQDDNYEFENSMRLDLQYELYRYRHHLKKKSDRFDYSLTQKKIASVQSLIDASKYHNDSAANNHENLQQIHKGFAYRLNNPTCNETLKSARSAGFLWLMQAVFKFMFSTKGATVFNRCLSIQNKTTALPKVSNILCDFFAVSKKAQSTPESLPGTPTLSS